MKPLRRVFPEQVSESVQGSRPPGQQHGKLQGLRQLFAQSGEESKRLVVWFQVHEQPKISRLPVFKKRNQAFGQVQLRNLLPGSPLRKKLDLLFLDARPPLQCVVLRRQRIEHLRRQGARRTRLRQIKWIQTQPRRSQNGRDLPTKRVAQQIERVRDCYFQKRSAPLPQPHDTLFHLRLFFGAIPENDE